MHFQSKNASSAWSFSAFVDECLFRALQKNALNDARAAGRRALPSAPRHIPRQLRAAADPLACPTMGPFEDASTGADRGDHVGLSDKSVISYGALNTGTPLLWCKP